MGKRLTPHKSHAIWATSNWIYSKDCFKDKIVWSKEKLNWKKNQKWNGFEMSCLSSFWATALQSNRNICKYAETNIKIAFNCTCSSIQRHANVNAEWKIFNMQGIKYDWQEFHFYERLNQMTFKLIFEGQKLRKHFIRQLLNFLLKLNSLKTSKKLKCSC